MMPEDNKDEDKDKFLVTMREDILKKLKVLRTLYVTTPISSLNEIQRKEYFNLWADFWRYVIGPNMIPANTQEKTVSVPWKLYQNEPVSEEQHQQWKAVDAFNHGMAVIAGKVWHNTAKKGLYLILVDLDNQKAINEFCTRNGVKTPLAELAKRMIVEQHQDELNKAHVMFYATHPFPKKSSDVARLSEVLEHDEVPAIEVKGAGEHGLLFCTPSPHRNGYNYEIIGTREPQTIDQMQDHIQNICNKYGMQYPTVDNNTSQTDNNLIPLKQLFEPRTKILKGHNRHLGILRLMDALLVRNQSLLPLDKIKPIAEDYNNEYCEPPLDKKEVVRQWKDALKWVHKLNRQRALEQYQREERQNRELVELELANSQERENEKNNPLRIGVLARLNEESKNHYATGQLSSLGMLYKRVWSAYSKCYKCGRDKETPFNPPKTIQYFLENFGDHMCKFYFNSECDGHVKVEPRWVNALDIEVTDTSSLQDIDRIKCILFGDHTKGIGIGENVTILGAIYMETAKSGLTFPISYIQDIEYEDRQQEDLTSLDIDAIKRFRNRFPDDNELIEQFVKMTACHVFGHDNIKEGILYMISNAKADKLDRREREHGAIISRPGRAKTALLLYATKLMTRSTFETAQMSTGLSLLTVVENTGEMKILRLGPVATSLFACIDEFNKLTNIDQEKFFGVMQEGFFTNNKFGNKQKIIAPTTILVSLNPPEGSRSITASDGKIDLTDVNIISPIWDRFDFKFYIPPMNAEADRRELANKKADLEGHENPDYSKFIKKWFMYAKQHFNPKLTKEAKSILVEAFLEMTRHNSEVSPRRLDALFNATKARARVLLKNVAGSEDAIAIVKFYGQMIKNYELGIIEAKDVIDVGAEECFKILAEQVLGEPILYTVKELLEQACKSNPQVEKYIKSGIAKRDYFDRSNNKQARAIYERLMIKHPAIETISKNPTTIILPRNKCNPDSQSDQSDYPDRYLETRAP